MEIDWFTFSFQIINFLVLVWLLKRFLYKPIINAMDRREEKITQRVNEALSARQDAEREAEDYRRKSQQLDHAREELLAEAGRDAEDWKHERLQEARTDVERARGEWQRSIKRERAAFLRDLRQRAGKQVHAMSRHVLEKLCGDSLEDQVIESFLARLQQVDEQQRSEIAASIRNSHHKIFVETGFELPDESRDRVCSIIHKYLTDGVDIEFKVVPELICGIELKAAGYKVAWSAAETLDELEDEFANALDQTVPR
ncbi:hypothetical protein [Symmachiella dynata]|uniref:F0F1 ATP synthase subunit B family protein n=1 Tax=Symmachiella dynata TaxID=2527995 RepID=UPI0030EED0EE